MKTFLKRKNIEISARRYGIDALGAMAQGLFCSLLIGTIIKTLGQQLGRCGSGRQRHGGRRGTTGGAFSGHPRR